MKFQKLIFWASYLKIKTKIMGAYIKENAKIEARYSNVHNTAITFIQPVTFQAIEE